MSKSKSKEIKPPKVISVFASIHSAHYSDKDHEEIAKALRKRNDEKNSGRDKGSKLADK